MGHLLLLRPAINGEGYEVLLQRRGRHLREAFHWGIPGGGYDSPERYALKQNISPSMKWKIGKRAALREFIEECGGGYHPILRREKATVGAIPELEIRSITFEKVLYPPGLGNMISDDSLVSCFAVPYGSCGKFTSVFLYVMRESTDSEFLKEWTPRAIPHYRCEIDESYCHSDCQYGYIWVNLHTLLNKPTKPVESSSQPTCEFVCNIFTMFSDDIQRILTSDRTLG